MKTVAEQIDELRKQKCGRCDGGGRVDTKYDYKTSKQIGGKECALCAGTGIKSAGIRTYRQTFLVEAEVEVRDPMPGEDADKYFLEIVNPAFNDVNFGDTTPGDPTRERAGEVWCTNDVDEDEYFEDRDPDW